MSTMDSIEEKYQDEIATLENDNEILRNMNKILKESVEDLTESRDEWKREWRLMEAAEKKAEEQIAALEAASAKQAEEIGRLIKAYDEYIVILVAEINDFAGLAFAHGFQSSRVQEGKDAREKITQAKVTLKEASHEPT